MRYLSQLKKLDRKSCASKELKKKKFLLGIQQFLEHLEFSGAYSSNTVTAYRKDLSLYAQFLQIPSSKKLDFYEYMNCQKFTARTKARVISSLRSCLRFLEKRGFKEARALLKSLHAVPVKLSLPKLVSMTEFDQIYLAASVEDRHKSARNHLTLLLLFGLGCRISELIQLNLQDISELDRSLVVTGKRNKQRLLPLTDDLFHQIKNYIQNHRSFIEKESNMALLLNNKGKRPSRVDIWRWLAAWSKKAGLENIKGPHQFRHGFATGLLENGADLRSIQFLLGHSNIQTTQIYTSVRKKHLRKVILAHHPLSFVKRKASG